MTNDNADNEKNNPQVGAEDIPTDAMGTARRLWASVGPERWRLVVAAAC